MSEPTNRLGPAMRRTCKERGWSLAHFAREVGITPGDLQKYLKGTHRPALDTVINWERRLGLPLGSLSSLCVQDRASDSGAVTSAIVYTHANIMDGGFERRIADLPVDMRREEIAQLAAILERQGER
jgi:transcriptional regulator with XRE-family HTH domain